MDLVGFEPHAHDQKNRFDHALPLSYKPANYNI